MRIAAPLATERAGLMVEAMRLSRERAGSATAALPREVAPEAAPQLLSAMSRLTTAGVTTAAAGGTTNATTGLTTVNAAAERVFFAIVAAAQNATVSENVIAWRGGPYGGILAGRGARLVAGNDIVVSGGDDAAAAFSFGIVSGLESTAADGVEILGNMVTGQAFAFGLNGCDAALVQGNVAVGGHAGVMVNAGEGVRIEGNGAFGCRIGVLAVDTTRLRIEGNVIAASFTQGILGLHSGNRPSGCIRISGNLLLRCGVRSDATAVAISYAAMDAAPGKIAAVDSTELVVEHNGVHDTGWPVDGERARVAHAISLIAPRVTVHGNDVTWGHPVQSDEGLRLLMEERAKPHRGIVVTPLAAQGFPPGNDPAWAASVVISDNRVRGPSLDTLVDVREGPKAQDRPPRFRQALVTGNVIEHWGPLDTTGATATVELRVSEDALVSVSANVVRGSARMPSVLVEGPKEIAWAGNATSGQLIGSAGRPNVIA
jgi:hypothetical protein